MPLIGAPTINAFIEKIIASYERPNKMFTMLEDAPLTVNELAQKYYSFICPAGMHQPPILQVRRLAIAFSYLEYLTIWERLSARSLKMARYCICSSRGLASSKGLAPNRK